MYNDTREKPKHCNKKSKYYEDNAVLFFKLMPKWIMSPIYPVRWFEIFFHKIWKALQPPYPLTSYFFQGKFGVRGVFFPAGNYFLNPRQMQKISHSKKKKEKKNYMTHTKSQPIFFFFPISVVMSLQVWQQLFHCHAVKKKPCGLPRISYFSEGFCTDMQIKQRDAGDLFLFFSEVLSLSAKAEVANQLNLPILRSHSPWSKLNFRESLVPGSMHAFIR